MEHRVVEPGLVKKTSYKTNPLHKSVDIENPHLSFHKNTSRVFRIDKLADSILTSGNRINERYLTMSVVDHICKALTAGRLNKGLDCTIIDGTAWGDAVATKEAKFSVLYANVFWQDNEIMLVVMLGYQRTYKTTKLFRMQESNATPVFVRFRPDEDSSVISARITDYLNRRSYDPVSYQDSSTIMYALAGCFNPMIEYPVAAASLLDGFVWFVDRPYRHHHVIHSPEYIAAKKLVPIRRTAEEWEVQGFLTNHRNFVHRKRAMHMAVKQQMPVDSEGCHVQFGRMKNPLHGGIIQAEDIHQYGMLVSAIDLFSEDIW